MLSDARELNYILNLPSSQMHGLNCKEKITLSHALTM